MEALKPTFSRFRFAVFLSAALSLSACSSRDLPDLPPQRSVLAEMPDSPQADEIHFIEVSMQTPARSPWSARLEKKPNSTQWEISHRSDAPGTTDQADSAFIRHWIDVLYSFATEEKTLSQRDPANGFSPYRVEIRIRGERTPRKEIHLLLGDPTGAGIFFKRGVGSTPGRKTAGESSTWIGRGALTLFLGNLVSPDAFVNHSVFSKTPERFERIRLEKLDPPSNGAWEFTRKTAPQDALPLIDRIIRQRLSRVLHSEPVEPLLSGLRPDWKLTLFPEDSEKSEEAETLEIYFLPDRAIARNPKRSPFALELYPEFAGALRAFTQTRFTPVKSLTK